MADLDLTEFFKEGSGAGPANLDWLDVSEEDYRRLDNLPKQNLDVTPDLKAIWRHQDEPATQFVPNTGGPKTMGDMSDRHGPLRPTPEDILRTARLAIMQTPNDPRRIAHTLSSRYDAQALANAKTALASVLAERGLLGGYYIDAADFPTCNRGDKKASDFVRRFGGDARFVKAKPECKDCTHRMAYAEGMGHCGVFHKQIEVEVPYTEELAEAVEKNQAAKGKQVQASGGLPAKTRVQQALLATNTRQAGQTFSGRNQLQPPRTKAASGDPMAKLIAVSSLTKKKNEAEQQKVAATKARPIIAMLRREMLKGRSLAELKTALRLSFDMRDLKATQQYWAPIYKEAGLYGTVYTTQDSFDDCRVGADFLAKHSSPTKAIVAGEKCGSCIFNQVGRCMMYGKKLVAKADQILTDETVSQVIWEQKLAGKLPHTADQVKWGDSPKDALVAIYKAASGPKPATGLGGIRQAVERGFYGHGAVAQQTNELTKRTILRTASQLLNEGLYGNDLLTVLKSRFEVRDLAASAEDLKSVLSEQGLQGIKYIDPTVYEDYGHGCKTAAAKHRSRAAVKYLKVGEKCASCVFQTTPGHCSVINKQLVVEPPYVDKAAEQQAILASGNATEVDYADLVNNGLSMMAEYELQHGSGNIDLNPAVDAPDVTIEFGPHDIKL